MIKGTSLTHASHQMSSATETKTETKSLVKKIMVHYCIVEKDKGLRLMSVI